MNKEQKVINRLDKKLFYQYLKTESNIDNKYKPIFFFMPISSKELYYELVFDFTSHKPDGSFNPIMHAQFIDKRQNGIKKYIVPDLHFDCIKEKITTDYKLYKYLNAWITKALKNYEKKEDKKCIK